MTLHLGDCLDVMRGMDSQSVNLVMTSPPYADQRKYTYGGVKPGEYVDWFMPRAAEIKRVVKDDGSFVLNIKEKVVGGTRHTYVMKLIIAMQEKLGWRCVDEYIWAKTNALPTSVKNRFRDGWERLIHFTVKKDFKFRPQSVMIPVKDSTTERMGRLRGKDLETRTSENKSGLSNNFTNHVGRKMVYPDNVLRGSTESHNRGHSAVYPEYIPAFFVNLLTNPGDMVMDPFCGSGTTMVAAQRLGRKWIGIDKEQLSIDVSRERLSGIQPPLMPT